MNENYKRLCRNCRKIHIEVETEQAGVYTEFVLCEPKILEDGVEIYTSLYEEMNNIEYLEYRYEQKVKANGLV
jgi:hypothetical protein